MGFWTKRTTQKREIPQCKTYLESVPLKLLTVVLVALITALATTAIVVIGAAAQQRSSLAFPYADALLRPDRSAASSDAKREAASISPRPGNAETSECLIGSVAVGIVFLESNGVVDSSTETWTTARESQVVSEINSGLQWLANGNLDADVSFAFRTNRSVPTRYEPINRPSTDEGLWISDAMNYLGYPDASYFTQVRDYVNELRGDLDTDWAFAIFMVDSYYDSDGKFTDGLFAYAQSGGPFLVMTYDNNNWGIGNMDNVVAHETLHIFYATDEYDGNPEYSGYLNARDNEGAFCIMNPDASSSPIWTICASTRQQIGWRDSDGDGIQDIVDTFPSTTLSQLSPNPTNDPTPTCTGTITEIPYPNNNPHGSGRDVTINSIDFVEYRVDSGTWLRASATDGLFDEAEESFTFTISSLASGNHTIEARGKNSVGNMDALVPSYTILVDLTSPTVSIKSPLSNVLRNSSIIKVTWEGEDTVSGIAVFQIRLDDGSWRSMGTLTGYSLSQITDGTHELWVKAIDRAGNSAVSSVAFTVDTTSPSVSVASPGNRSELRSSRVTLSWSGLDEISGVDHYDVRLDDSSWIKAGASLAWNFDRISDGSHTFTVKAIDKAGNYKEVQIMFTVNTSLFGGPGWIDDIIVFGGIGIASAIAMVYFLIRRRRHAGDFPKAAETVIVDSHASNDIAGESEENRETESPRNKCSLCSKEVFMPFVCSYCLERFCPEHRLPENHNCPRIAKVKPLHVQGCPHCGSQAIPHVQWFDEKFEALECSTCGGTWKQPRTPTAK